MRSGLAQFKKRLFYKTTIYLILALTLALVSTAVTSTTMPLALFAQSEEQSLFQLDEIDSSEFPLVQLWVRSVNKDTTSVSTDSLTIDSFAVDENGQPASIVDFGLGTANLQVGILIDPVGLDKTAYSGQTYSADMIYAVHDMVTQEGLFLRNQDQLAVFTMLPDGNQQTVQAWTLEPNLIHNSLAQQSPTPLNADLLPTDAWMNVLNQFEADVDTGALAGTKSVKGLILFLVGSQTIPPEFVAGAAAAGIQLHIVDMAVSDPDVNRTADLSVLAQETGGTYLAYNSAADLANLHQSLFATRKQYRLSYLSKLAEAGPVTVSVTLPDGTVSQINTAPLLQLDANQGNTIANSAPAQDAAVGPQPTGLPPEEPVVSEQESSNETNNSEQASTTSESSSAEAQAATVQPISEQADAVQAVSADQASSGAADTSGAAVVQELAPQDLSNEVPATMITIPFLNIDVPRIALQIALPLLILLIGYVFYTERRDRRLAKEMAMVNGYTAADPQWTAPRAPIMQSPTSRPVTDPYENFQPSAVQDAAGGMSNYQQADSPGQPLAQPPAQPPAQPNIPQPVQPPVPPPAQLSEQRASDSIYVQQSQDDADTTSAMPYANDDELTYRLTDEVETPLIGHLMRVTSDPNLPQMLPIHRLSSAVGAQHQLYIGRHSKKNTIVINDKRISREHAVIVQKDGQLYLRDNGSTSGTFLNWKQLRAGEELILRHSDLVSLGDVVYEFRMQGEDEATVAL